MRCVLAVGNRAPGVQYCPEPLGLPTGTHWLSFVWLMAVTLSWHMGWLVKGSVKDTLAHKVHKIFNPLTR